MKTIYNSRDKFKDRFKMFSEINVTPLVDIALTLLSVFLVTAPLLQQGLSVELPQAQAAALEKTVNDVIVTIKADESIYLNETKQPLSEAALEMKLKVIYENKKNKDLFIEADKSILYGKVIRVMSIAKKAGVERIGMVTQPEKEL